VVDSLGQFGLVICKSRCPEAPTDKILCEPKAARFCFRVLSRECGLLHLALSPAPSAGNYGTLRTAPFLRIRILNL